jgi:ubiquinone/menaquinone biosynthesis C-methylase UbiE
LNLARQRTWHYFEEKERRKWQNPEDIMKDIGLKSGMTFMDIGCGNGFFTLPAARLVGPAGLVYGLDISDSAIAEIRQKAAKEGLKNINLKVGKAEDLLLCRSCADILFFGIVLHDFEDAPRVLEKAHQMLKPGGRLADLDWKKREMPMGPPVSVRFDEATATRLIESAGFKVSSSGDWGEYNYLLMASA